jgi:mRNA-degrading endonuclease toxin of MazEF toxin-antitoxin module
MQEWYIYNAKLGEGEGHEQSYERPCILIKALDEMNMSIVIPLTSTPEAIRFPFTATIERTNTNMLRNDSVALVFQIRSISNQRLTSQPIGRLSEEKINKIKEIIKQTLNL